LEIDPPWNPRTVVRSQPETELENEEAKDRDGTITICCSLCHTSVRNTGTRCAPCGTLEAHLREREPKSGSKNDTKESQPAETQFDSSWETVEWFSDEGAPDRGNRLAYDRVGDKSESNDPKVE